MSPRLIDRRQFLGSAVAGTLIASGTRAVAATNFTVGNASVTALSDGHFNMPPEMFLGTPQALRDRLGEPVQIAANTYAYRAGGRVFLFDAGAGLSPFITEAFPTASRLPEDLQAAGISPLGVTDIVITHMHPDHVGGLVVNGVPAFPNALIHIADSEWDFWNAEDFAMTGPDGMRAMIANVQETSRIIEPNIALHGGEMELGEGVSVFAAPGHTPGHTVIRLDGGAEKLLIIGDAVVHEDVHFENPNFGWALDVDGDLAVRTRRALLDQAVTEHALIAAAHVSRPGLGRVERRRDGYRFIAL